MRFFSRPTKPPPGPDSLSDAPVDPSTDEFAQESAQAWRDTRAIASM